MNDKKEAGTSDIERPTRFFGLHAHSGASAMDGLGSPQDHFAFCKENGLDGMTLTEHGHMNSFAPAYLHIEKLKKAGESFKYVPGAELYLHPDLDQWKLDYENDKRIKEDAREAEKQAKKNKEKTKTQIEATLDEDGEVIDMTNALTIENEDETKGSTKFFNPVNRRHHLVVVPKSSKGLMKLFHLVSRGYTEGFYRFPRIDYSMLKQAAKECDNELIVSTACLHPDTTVLTEQGELSIKEVVDKLGDNEIRVLSWSEEHQKLSYQQVVWGDKTRKNAKLLCLKLKDGKIVKLTPDHKVFTQRGWVEAKDLLKSDKVLINDNKGSKTKT